MPDNLFAVVLEKNTNSQEVIKSYLETIPFIDNIKLYTACLGGEPLAGVLVYLNNATVHTQYISASPEGKRIGALDALFPELICNTYGNYRYFDFGRSTEHEGTYLNEALIFQKEGFGGRGVCYDTYEWEI